MDRKNKKKEMKRKKSQRESEKKNIKEHIAVKRKFSQHIFCHLLPTKHNIIVESGFQR